MDKSKRYEDYFKRQVVLEVLSGRVTKEEARRRYKIGGKSTVLKWMRIMSGLKASAVGTDPIPILRSMGKKEEKNTPIDEIEQEKLYAEIKRLQAALEHAELKGRAYQIMVEIAREQYGIDLEKKPGAKQSKDSKKNNPK